MKFNAATIDELIVDREVRPAGGSAAAARCDHRGDGTDMIGYGELIWESMASSGVWPLIAIAPQKYQIRMYVAA